MTKSFEEVWGEMTGVQQHAFHMKVWGALGKPEERAEELRRLMAGEIRLVTEEVARVLFDRHGRRIPPRGMRAEVRDADYDFPLVQPQNNFAERLARLTDYLGGDKRPLGDAEFELRTAAIAKRLGSNETLAGLLLSRSMCLPIVLPQMAVNDYGQVLDEVLLDAVGCAYEAEFPGRKFYNQRRGKLAGEVTVVEGSHHETLLTALVKGPVVALYFPTALQGYSIQADLEQMATLPDGVLLAGALEPAAALIMYPDVLAHDGRTPGLDCAALRREGFSLYFKADNDNLHFTDRIPPAFGDYSGGLVVLG